MSELFDIVNEGINGVTKTTILIDKMQRMNFDESEINSTRRLLKAWELVNKDIKFKYDFEIALRDFLIFNKIKVRINDYTLSDFGYKIGLRSNNDELFCIANYPEYINKDFALYSAELREIKKVNNKFDCLNTNSYIKRITNGKFEKYKSEEQKLCVTGCLKTPLGYTCLVSMSTGGGKSLITQSVAYQFDGLTIVIVPTISLMIDQVTNARSILNASNDEIVFYHSGMKMDKIISGLKNGTTRILFISPETLVKNSLLKQVLFDINSRGKIRNLVIDEAHIVFEWGDSFRLDFQCLDIFRKQLLEFNHNIRTYLLSATFSEQNVTYLKNMFSEDDKWIELRCDSLRKEIRYNFVKADSNVDKMNKALELIYNLPHPMIVYVSRPDEAEELKSILVEKGINNVYSFTGLTGSNEREKTIIKWKNNDFQIMIATCAFGVGVDKKDVRTVLHLYVPDNASKYYQEAGRAGRDGKSALNVLLYNELDIDFSFTYIKSKVLRTETILGRWFSMLKSSSSLKTTTGIVKIDTSVKPEYSIDDNMSVIGNSKDVSWNVYVILFLKRHGLLKIVDVEYIDEKYYLTIVLLEKGLYSETDYIRNVIQKLRDLEWHESEKAYNMMKNMLKKCNKECISELFINTFKSVPFEYCAGCNSHTDLIYGHYSGLPIVSSNPYLNNGFKSSYFDNTNTLIIKTLDFVKTEEYLIENGQHIIIQLKEKNLNSTNDLFYTFSYDEFYNLIHNNLFFLDSEVVFECPDKEEDIIILLRYLKKINGMIKIILLVHDNYYLESYDKRLYEMFEGSYKEAYVIDKELR